MAHFMATCRYSPEARAALLANPTDRTSAAAAIVESVGGKFHSGYLKVDELEILVIFEAPDAIAATALSTTLQTSGAFTSVRITALLTASEAIEALKLSAETKSQYKPPTR
ncbi:MAG TPA: GYD domain-containing protein [Steroidobacteraceae bacterium]|nr:GYD domain-containing protein [Steroidobacteraceae bacterium]